MRKTRKNQRDANKVEMVETNGGRMNALPHLRYERQESFPKTTVYRKSVLESVK